MGEKLDVATVLEGTVRRSGSRLRITVQLVNAADGYQLWSERYDREMTDVFAVQDEIASAIATRLRGAMHAEADRGRARGGTKNLEAYELLLRGRALQTKRGRFLPQARRCFERAIALDPQYAEALAWLSDSYRLMGVFGVAPFAEVMPKAKALAERALAIDPELAEAWATLAAIEEQYERDFARSDSLYERALAIDPRHSRARAQRALWRVLHTVYLSGLIRDPYGQKMSKTKGNTVDPLGTIDELGADALRFAVVHGATPGQRPAVRAGQGRERPQLREQAVERDAVRARRAPGRRSRPTPSGGCRIPRTSGRPIAGSCRARRRRSPPWTARWPTTTSARSRASCTRRSGASTATGASSSRRSASPTRSLPDAEREATWWALVEALDTYLRLLHPVMPFITERLWQALPHRAARPGRC